MAEWRFRTGWTEAELAAGLERATSLGRNFPTGAELAPEDGWDLIHSRALIAREPPGPPLPDGPFERVWRALQRFHHSDPRIVVAHFRDDVPLRERRTLLELQAVGLRFLCPAAVAGIREESGPAWTLRGFSLETLDGHLEQGREWFLLEKDHGTGQVHFRLEASWRPGEFPTWWSRLGFHVVGRGYQRAWHRLAHLRLRRIGAGRIPDDVVGPDHVAHEGPPMPTEPVQFFAVRGAGARRVGVEEEVEEMNTNPMWRAIGLGALSGLRSLGPAALVARELASRGRGPFAGGAVARTLGALAAGEVVADKLPFVPARTQAPSLLARAAAGAFVGGRTARRHRSRLGPALLGAAAAVGAAHLAFHARDRAARRSKALGQALALVEDALVFWGGSRLAASAR